jgi:hypothetical protein
MVHGFDHRQAETFGQRREHERLAIGVIPVLVVLADRPGNDHPVGDAPGRRVVHDLLLVLFLDDAGDDQLPAVIAQQGHQHVEVLLGAHHPDREQERRVRLVAGTVAGRRAGEIGAVVDHRDLAARRRKVAHHVSGHEVRDGDDPVDAVDLGLHAPHVARQLAAAGGMLMDLVEVMNRHDGPGAHPLRPEAAILVGEMDHVEAVAQGQEEAVPPAVAHIAHRRPQKTLLERIGVGVDVEIGGALAQDFAPQVMADGMQAGIRNPHRVERHQE